MYTNLNFKQAASQDNGNLLDEVIMSAGNKSRDRSATMSAMCWCIILLEDKHICSNAKHSLCLSPRRLFPYCPVYTIQPIVQPVAQPVVSCIQTFNRLSNRLNEFNMVDSCNPTSNRSRRVNIQPVVKTVEQPVVSCKRRIIHRHILHRR